MKFSAFYEDQEATSLAQVDQRFYRTLPLLSTPETEKIFPSISYCVQRSYMQIGWLLNLQVDNYSRIL